MKMGTSEKVAWACTGLLVLFACLAPLFGGSVYGFAVPLVLAVVTGAVAVTERRRRPSAPEAADAR